MITQSEEARYEQLCGYAFNFARSDACEELAKMVDAGLNPNLKNHKGDSLLMLASYHGALQTTRMLIQKGAQVDAYNDRGQTPLAGACFKGNLEMVKLLVENGANIDANNGMGLTPYSFAVMFGRSEIAQYLLDMHPKPSFFKRASSGVLKVIGYFKNPKIR